MNQRQPDLLTVMAVGAVVYTLAKILHEAVGHGVICHAVGADWQGFSSAWNRCDYASVGDWARRLTKAGGTLANLLVGISSLLLLRLRPPGSGAARYFIWLMAGVNSLMAAGYLAVDPLIGFGDWTAFLEGLPGAAVLRWVLVAVGAGLYAILVVVLLRGLRSFLPPDPGGAAWRLCLAPYLSSGGLLLTGAALLNSEGPIYAFTSALATLGGTSAFAWMAACAKPSGGGEAVVIQRSWPWVITGALFAVGCVLILGPGVEL